MIELACLPFCSESLFLNPTSPSIKGALPEYTLADNSDFASGLNRNFFNIRNASYRILRPVRDKEPKVDIFQLRNFGKGIQRNELVNIWSPHHYLAFALISEEDMQETKSEISKILPKKVMIFVSRSGFQIACIQKSTDILNLQEKNRQQI